MVPTVRTAHSKITPRATRSIREHGHSNCHGDAVVVKLIIVLLLGKFNINACRFSTGWCSRGLIGVTAKAMDHVSCVLSWCLPARENEEKT